ncbi:MAG TPA: hypothetical protein VLH75_05670 [Longimicrobiales bacterium]|nr:hypothetical protein [Longimicrobiales bacterium]
MRSFIFGLLLAVSATGCVREPEGPPEVPLLPGGYRLRLDGDRVDPGQFVTEETPDGVRVTNGPGGIVWRPQDTVTVGDFRAEAAFTLMGAPVAYREGYGVFVGGRNLDGPSPRYLYLMVRPTGEYMVKRRVGQATETLVDWLPHASVLPVAADGDTPMNVVAIEAVGGEARFLVNGTVVFSMPTAEAEPFGVAGLRVNHRLDLIVGKWSVGPPPRAAPTTSVP